MSQKCQGAFVVGWTFMSWLSTSLWHVGHVPSGSTAFGAR